MPSNYSSKGKFTKLTKMKKRIDTKRFNNTITTISVAELLNKNVIDGYIDYSRLDCFHKAIGSVLFASQFFATMPVLGVMSSHPYKVKFQLLSIPVFATMCFIIYAILIMYLITENLIRKVGLNAKNSDEVIFYVCVISACILFFRLAVKWPKLIRFWSKTELIFLRYPYEIPKWKLSTRIRVASLVFGLLSLCEHSTYYMSKTYSFFKHSEICNISDTSFKRFMLENYEHVFNHINYSVPVSIMILILNCVFTLIWNYSDLFIALVSLGVAIRFEQLNVRIVKLTKQKSSEEVWSEIRQHYVKICDLIDVVDEHLSLIILLSALNDLYFVCCQLLNIFNKLRWSINYIYFWFSLLFLIGRTIFVFMVAATINDESKLTLKELRKLPTSSWCSEVERLTNQTSSQSVALSGMKFFFMTRKLLFGMAGTIVTYELVLLQFDESSRKKGLPPLCN